MRWEGLMADVDPPRECNPLCAVGRLSGGRGGGMPWVGATLCTLPAFSLVPKNAMVDNLHGGPHLLTLRSCVSGCVYFWFLMFILLFAGTPTSRR